MAEIFDKMVLGFNKGINSVKEGSKTMVEKANINTSIREKDNTKKQILTQIGAVVYDLQRSGAINIGDISGLVDAASQCDNEIAQLNERLRELDMAKIATPPPAAEVPVAPAPVAEAPIVEAVAPALVVEAPAAPASAEVVICTNCGRPNKPFARFCVGCGTQLA